MIEDGDVHGLADQGQPARDAHIGGAGARVAARMIVRQDQSLAAMAHDVDDNAADGQIGAVGIAVKAGEVNAERVVIDMGDPQMFLGGVASARQPAKNRRAGSSPLRRSGDSAR